MRRLTLSISVAVLTFSTAAILVTLTRGMNFAVVRAEDVPAPSVPAPAAVASVQDVVAVRGCAVNPEDWEVLTQAVASEGRRVYRSGGCGKAISKPQPAYPMSAKAARASGTVTVQIIVGEAGKVIAARATSGHPLLQDAAVKAACSSRFSPTMLSGWPILTESILTYNFVLQ